MNRRTRGILTVAVSMTLALLIAGCATTQTAGRQIETVVGLGYRFID